MCNTCCIYYILQKVLKQAQSSKAPFAHYRGVFKTLLDNCDLADGTAAVETNLGGQGGREGLGECNYYLSVADPNLRCRIPPKVSTPESRKSPSSPPVIVECWYTPLGTATAHMSSRFTKLVNLPSLAFLVHVTYTRTDSHQQRGSNDVMG